MIHPASGPFFTGAAEKSAFFPNVPEFTNEIADPSPKIIPFPVNL